MRTNVLGNHEPKFKNNNYFFVTSQRDLCDSASDWLPLIFKPDPKNLWTQNSLGKRVATAEVLNVVRHVIHGDLRKFWVGNLNVWKHGQASPMSQITSGNYWEAPWSTITVKEDGPLDLSPRGFRPEQPNQWWQWGTTNRGQGRASDEVSILGKQ